MAGAVGIVFGLCVLSFTLGAAMMYVLVRRREDAVPEADAPVERTWVERPVVVEPVDDDYDTRPIHRNPVVGLPRLEPALAALAEPAVTPVGDEDGEAEPVSDAEPEPVAAQEQEPEAHGSEAADVPELPSPAEPQPAEQTTSVEREDFRRRYLRTFDEVRRKADTN
ncbi:hypothetical protein SAMN05216553_107421 [Lentzea fradiae]|uniref:Uncharacterized protein n=1 Tax=Lentzea fradiae TaxID=200378 RepID=A0A1G7TQW5_9PSEU|nr:hypothetical protein [Lentzea fradiae]SDG37723.1 hypothetical protein SAMN05216553_107421 [Lentzea fradiae]